MDRHLEDAVDKGANVVLGGSRSADRPTRLYYGPTAVTDVVVDTHADVVVDTHAERLGPHRRALHDLDMSDLKTVVLDVGGLG